MKHKVNECAILSRAVSLAASEVVKRETFPLTCQILNVWKFREISIYNPDNYQNSVIIFSERLGAFFHGFCFYIFVFVNNTQSF